MLAAQFNRFVENGDLRPNSIINLGEYICNSVQGRRIIIVRQLDVVGHRDKIGEPQNIENTGAAAGGSSGGGSGSPSKESAGGSKRKALGAATASAAAACVTKKKKFADDASAEELLECPVCMDFMSGRIFQCCEGHVLCELCLEKMDEKRCPTCRQETGKIRNRMLGQVAERVHVTCPNDGCEQRLTVQDLAQHSTKCDARSFACPLCATECGGGRGGLWKHLQSQHRLAVRNNTASSSTRFKLGGERIGIAFCNQTWGLEHEGFHFFVDVRCTNGRIPLCHFTAYCLGSEEQAAKFECEIRVQGEGGSQCGDKVILLHRQSALTFLSTLPSTRTVQWQYRLVG